MGLPITRRLFTVDDYYRMADAGILTEDDRVELIEGEVITMAPIGSRHAACVEICRDVFPRVYGHLALVRSQNPIRLSDRSEPEPDVALVRRRPDYYAGGHPRPADVFLIVEVADSSVEYDRTVKLPLYARNGIPESWLIDLNLRVIEIYRDPGPDGYRSVRVAHRNDRLSPSAFSDLFVAVSDLIG